MGAPPPTTVWLFEPGRLDAVPGTLTLEAAAVVFSPSGDEVPVEIRRKSVRRVRRHRLTPVLEVRYERDGLQAVALFYFAKPPELPQPGEKADRGPIGMLLPNARRIERSGAMLSMRAANKLLRRDIERWAGAIPEEEGR